jgi:predicted dehydrogenase
MEHLRFGIIGIKGMGRGHAHALAGIERARLAAVADLDLAAAERLAGEHGAQAFTDYRQMLERVELDAVIIATPHYLHAPMALDCLAAGRHVFVEKPVAVTVSEADRMVTLAREKGLTLAVGHNYRTFPGNIVLKRLLDEGAVGAIHRVFWTWLEARPEAYYARDRWRGTWAHAGGGVLMNQVSHDIDLLCWLLGEPVEVAAMLGNWGHAAEIEDTATATVRFAGGAHASLQFSTCDRRLNFRQIDGDRGTITYQDEKNANSFIPDLFRLGRYRQPMREFIRSATDMIAQPELIWEEVPVPREGHGGGLLESFVAAILDGGEPIVNGEEGRRALELINAIVLSALRKKIVTLPVDRVECDALMEELREGRIAAPRYRGV